MKILVLFILAFALVHSANAAILATDGTSSDVAAKLAAAEAGDIVTIPSGSYTWTAECDPGVEIAANVTLQGAGMSSTTIVDNVDVSTNTKLIDLRIADTGTFRITGIKWDATGSARIHKKDGGTIAVRGPGNLRIDNCRIEGGNDNYKTLHLGEAVYGVMHDCIFTAEGFDGAIYAYNGRNEPTDTDPSEPDIQGNYEWTQPTAFGDGSYYFYVEDCQMIGDTPGAGARLYDGYTGAKLVVRFCDFENYSIGETHETGHANNDRGMRSREIYGNLSTTTGTHNFLGINLANGTGLVWGNDFGDRVYKHQYRFRVTRGDNATYTQSASPTGWGYAGADFNGTGSDWDGGTFNSTDTTYGYPCLDQTGRGPGDLLYGYGPNKLNLATGTLAWPNQALEPMYIFANTVIGRGDSGAAITNSHPNRIQANRDYYWDSDGSPQISPTSPFDGTSGVGWGTLANRPTTCTPGVAYWATDQGSWNTSSSNPYGVQQNGADGVLYKCTAPNTWTLYYTPYTYPHPLRTVEDPPSSPSDLNVAQP